MRQSKCGQAQNKGMMQRMRQVHKWWLTAILRLLQTPSAERPFRTTVDGTGLNSVIESVNHATEEAMQHIYGLYGMNNLLALKQR
ncbi:hypothetical protein L1286_05235 [Pseudoalteromonas sp. SMS1]|uniref:hypothetical protein n=1 Tax=Pseudoalteromonas sp. SMS1 TaxID=2908894 RepID=UPI001F398BBB|nr:hypothetical protein [Pseudoalteromonas sp. SMS1]MCF2856863.1 hypothetical protein [Pseudoalteromonas sp. SMS1]